MPDVNAHSVDAVSVKSDNSLEPLTTLRLGGKASTLAVVSETRELVDTVRGCGGSAEPVLILAGGSNVVIGDDGFPGTVVLLRTRGVREIARRADEVVLRVAAGEPWDGFVADVVQRGLSGVECLSGIPGSAGATPIQNVGAYGQEVAETIVAVHVYDRETDRVVEMPAAECGFAYRTSVFKHSARWVVLEVDFQLTAAAESVPIRYAELARRLGVAVGDRVPLDQARDTVLKLRAGKGMVLDRDDPDTWSVGSFFTNPVLDADAWDGLRGRVGADGAEPPSWPAGDGAVKVPAAWLIERAGFHKGYAGDGVAISTKHTLALTNRGTGTTGALLALAREIRDGVHDRFGVLLHPEPVLVNCAL
ncbi:UDP-N-acetylmuramate dehydrogenase [Mangrovihabitans endophyticus]|uniref:UDP-N-acetylmuramate dehydrogenase n=1 Tax=Mangrovihabitans endophyticus TaxID=1751298 RepID=UPI0035710E82